VRNSSLVERSCAENVTGLKHGTEAAESPLRGGLVGERSVLRRSSIERTGGAYRSENAGMSSVKHVRTVFAVSLRFPTQGQSASG
jgi:hypothetical protein